MKKTQSGFALIEGLLIILILAIIGFGGYYVWHSQQQTNKTLDTAKNTSQNAAQNTPNINMNNLDLAKGAVSLKYSDLWVAGDNSYDPTGQQPCAGNPVTSQEMCVDNVRFQLKKEGLTDGDHFGVTVNVYKRTNADSLRQWFDSDLGLPNGDPKPYRDLTISGQPALFYEGDYGKDEARVYYAVTRSNYGVVLSSILFRGQNYSYQNKDNIDYFNYRSDVETLAKSIEIQHP